MQISLDPGSATYRISAYGTGFIDINEERFSTSLVVCPEQLLTDWPPRSAEELTAGHLETVADLPGEIVILGTGARQHFPPTELLAPLVSSGKGFEIMDTSAACRTYNILMAEDRRVVAALMMIHD